MDDHPVLALAFQGHSAGVRVRKAMAEHGLKPGHGHVLMLLADAGSMGQRELVGCLEVDPSVLVALLNDLERDGLAERRRDPADRRRHIVEISARGRRLVRELNKSVTVLQAELFANLDAKEIATLKGLLDRVGSTPADESTCDEA